MQGSSWAPTAVNAKDIQNYFGKTLPNLIYSSGQKVDLENLTQSVNIRTNSRDSSLKNVFMKGNEVKGTQSTVEAKNSECESLGNGDSFDHLSSLISSQDTQARMRCGWMYDNSDPMNSRGAYGIPDGPLKTTAPGTWMWNLSAAKQKQHTEICRSIQDCGDIDASMYNKRCGWCKRSGKAVPIQGTAAAYPFSSRTACATPDLVVNGSSCPAPNVTSVDKLEGFTSGSPGNSCVPLANGAIPRDCLIQKVRLAGCSDEGSLYRALKAGSDNDYTSQLAQQQAWATYQQKNIIPMDATGLKTGKITIANALNDFKRLQNQAASDANTSLQYAARDLCFVQGALSDYDSCSEIQDNDTPPFTLDCLQKVFLRSGGQKAGAAYPNASTMNKWNSFGKWSAVKAYIQTLYTNTQSDDRATQQKAMLDYYGIQMQDKTTNQGPCSAPFVNPSGGNGYTYRGCFKDDTTRAISNFLGNTQSNDECFQKVSSAGYTVMGRQNFGECWGGNNKDWNRVGSAGCCQANGGGWTNQVYTSDAANDYGNPLQYVKGGDVQLYNNNKQIVVLNDNKFPASPGGNGCTITGPSVPPGTTVIGYRFGKSNPSSRYEVIFMDLSQAVGGVDPVVYYSCEGTAQAPQAFQAPQQPIQGGSGGYQAQAQLAASQPAPVKQSGTCPPPFANPTDGDGYAYQGCWKDDNRTIPNHMGHTPSNDECWRRVTAKGLTVMGRQNGTECWGGNGTDYKRAGAAGCCPANGGEWKNQVYTAK